MFRKDHISIAHLILAHKNPEQVRRLIRALAYEGNDFYVHIDAKINTDSFLSTLSAEKNVFFIKRRVNIKWAGYGTIQATLNGFAEILDNMNGRQYDYLHVLSGQDYPIKSGSFISNFLRNNYDKEFFDILDNSWPDNIHERYEKYHLVNLHFLGKHCLERLITYLFPKRKFPMQGVVAGSSNWFMITSTCAQYLLEKINGDRSLRRYFKYVWGADEFLFINLFTRSPFSRNLYKEGIHFMEWANGSAHARTLTKEDFSILAKSDKLFARKFNEEEDSEILNMIDKVIERQDTF